MTFLKPYNVQRFKLVSGFNVCLFVLSALIMVSEGGCGESSSKRHIFAAPEPECPVLEAPAGLEQNQIVGDGSEGSCTEEALRAAVEKGGNVTFDCGAGDITIQITSEIRVPHDTLIDGDGKVTLDGGGLTRILHTEARVVLTVMNLDFINGNASLYSDGTRSGGAIRAGWLGITHVFDCSFFGNQAAEEGIEGGGAIYQSNGGELVVVRSVFQGNHSISGGAIDNLLSPLTIVDSTFINNTSNAGGGAIYVDGASAYIDDNVGGNVVICGCRFEENETISTGGAVYLWAYHPDELFINRCSFVNNIARRPADGSALGGAVRTGNAPLQISNCLFHGNHADVHGGAYWTRGNYPTHIVNSTFYRNNAGVSGQEGGYGGALSGFNMHLENLTFVENHAEFTGGAVSAEGDKWTLRNSIFLDNSASNQWGTRQTCTRIIKGSNVIQWPIPEGNENPVCTEDAVLEDPLLGDLADNGGPTQTFSLLEGSPALEHGDECLDTDQRGEPRSESCDLGAFERQ